MSLGQGSWGWSTRFRSRGFIQSRLALGENNGKVCTKDVVGGKTIEY